MPSVYTEHVMPRGTIITLTERYRDLTTTEIIIILHPDLILPKMRAAVPVLLLVALAGCQHVFSASLEVAVSEEVFDERVEISDLQKSDGTKSEAESEEGRMEHNNCFGKAVRDQPELKFNPTASSVSEEMTQEPETQSAKGEKPEDELTEARAEVRVQTLNLSAEQEDSDETEERFDIEVLKHAAGETDMAVE
ncbi:uncharacterized protein Hap1MRO34_019351 isoform 1-T1 [Clarias gariepinus]